MIYENITSKCAKNTRYLKNVGLYKKTPLSWLDHSGSNPLICLDYFLLVNVPAQGLPYWISGTETITCMSYHIVRTPLTTTWPTPDALLWHGLQLRCPLVRVCTNSGWCSRCRTRLERMSQVRYIGLRSGELVDSSSHWSLRHQGRSRTPELCGHLQYLTLKWTSSKHIQVSTAI